MEKNQFALLRSRRFLPLFVTQFLGAFNDNLFKNALVILLTYVLAQRTGMNAQVLVTLAAGIFILPFFLCSATAGQLADKYDKAQLIQWVKVAEVGLMLLAAIGFALESIPFLLVVLFLMGAQSTFFSPLKYGILPDHLSADELIGGNAWIETATFLAILIGTLIGGLLILSTHGITLVCGLVLLTATLGWLASRHIPSTRPADAALTINYNLATATWRMVRQAAARRDIFLAILGISWFWLVGATFLAQFPNLVKDVIGGNEQIVTLLLVVFSIGIGVGSLMTNRMLKGQVHATYVPLGALGISLFTTDLFFASAHGFARPSAELLGAAAFLQSFAGWRILIDLLLIAIAGGIYIVPLTAIVQHRSEPSRRARNLASNSILNALFMVVAAIGSAFMLQQGFSVPAVFLTLAILNLAVAIYIARLLPGAIVKALIAGGVELFYRVEVNGAKHVQAAGDKVLIVANHQSYLDAVLIAAYLPDQLTFAINTFVAQNKFIKFFLALAKTFPLDPTNPLSTRALIEAIKQHEKVVIFPEGRITVTGALMKIYEGPGLIADKSGAKILPVRIEGAQYTPFSHLKGKVRMRLFPKIRVTFLPAQSFAIPETLKGRKRRQFAAHALYHVMTDMIFQSSDYRQTLFQSLVDARKIHGAGQVVLEDIERRPLTYGRTLAGSFVLGRALAKATAPGESVGMLLPNTAGAVVTFFALQAFGRVPALLNFSAGTSNVVSGCRTAAIKTVYSARRFIETAKLEAMAAEIRAAGIQLVYLEDLQAQISVAGKILGVLASHGPSLAYWLTSKHRDPDAPCVVLFTSGTEGSPKGVVLSHTNVQANRYQISAHIDFGPTDIVFNPLPMFHSFGLTCGTLLPVLSGIRTFLYPSPLHYRIIPELIYETNATLLFGTETFLAGYARFAHPYDFYSLRYVFTGAEKLKDTTRRMWSEHFGVRVFEGYGATETAPVLSMNTPMDHRPGSVGRFVPGLSYRLEPLPGIADGAKLWVSGPNIMAGYLRTAQPGVLQPLEDGWYDTGDLVEVDAQGFVTIKGRSKRFAKIGGEMISLAAVERDLSTLWPEHAHAVVNFPDGKKGEQLALVTDHASAGRDEIIAYAKRTGLSELSIPKMILKVDTLPLLGSGKTDYVAVKALVQRHTDAGHHPTKGSRLGR